MGQRITWAHILDSTIFFCNSGEHKITPENEGLSPVLNELSPEENPDLSTKTIVSGDNGDTGDKLNYIMEGQDDICNKGINSINNNCINYPKPSDLRIEHYHPFYYCKEHPKFQNVHFEVIERPLILSKAHQPK